MVEQRKLNYTVISVDVSEVSAPYNQVTGIPCSIFIDSEGKIKLATIGVLPLDAIKAILQAK
ncbi:MAG: TlpA family protein disulfide reductase [Planctomycetota bacterium]